jgi:hypothetical protein
MAPPRQGAGPEAQAADAERADRDGGAEALERQSLTDVPEFAGKGKGAPGLSPGGCRLASRRSVAGGQLEIIAVAGAAIHLQFPVGAGLLRQSEGEAALVVGAAQIDGGAAIGRHQAHRRGRHGLTGGEAGVEVQPARRGLPAPVTHVERRADRIDELQIALDAVGSGRERAQRQGGAGHKHRRQGTQRADTIHSQGIHDGLQEAFQRLSRVLPA